jgi:peptide/nickel transport system substrate-binding protein
MSSLSSTATADRGRNGPVRRLRPRRWRPWAVAPIAVIGLLAAGCGSSGSTSASNNTTSSSASTASNASQTVTPTGGAAAPAKQGGTVTVGLPSGAIDHLEPTLWYYATSWEIAYATCTPMLTFADSSGAAGVKPIGGVAQLPTVSDGGKVYTFTMKPGVEFANGQPITGQAIKYTFERMLSPKLASPGDGFFNNIVGAPAMIAGKAKSVSGIKATTNTVTFTLSQPVASFNYRMTLPFACPVPIGTPIKPLENGTALLSGPYVVKSYTPQRSLVLARNPHWNASQLGNRQVSNEITIQIGVDDSQAAQLIRAGQLATYGAPMAPTDALQASHDPTLKGRVFVNPLPATTYLWLNNTVPPLTNAKVRQAVNYAINRQAIQRVWGGPSQGAPTDQVLPPTMPGFVDANNYPVAGDPTKAKSLMAASGVHTPVSLTLRTLSDQPGYAQVAQAIQAELAPIGIKVNIVTAPDAVNGGVISAPKNHVPMGINTWTQDYPYADDFFEPLLNGDNITATGNNNYASYNNPTVNKQIATLTSTGTSEQWNELDKKIIAQDAPWAPLLNPTRVTLFSSTTCGAVFQPVYLVDFATLGACS